MKRRSFSVLSALSLLLFVAVVVLWVRIRTTREVSTVRYVLPDGYRGYFWIGADDAAGVDVNEVDGLVVLTIPENGILLVKDTMVLGHWHRSVAQYASGSPIMALGERPVRADDVVLWELGGSGSGVHTFLVGTQAERDAYYTDEGRAAFRLYVERLVPTTNAAQ